MARPILSDVSLLAHIFSPKSHDKPKGIRKTVLKGVKGGRHKGRLAAFNRMSPVNQELLKRSGHREEYLRGQLSLAEVRRSVRPQAVSLGVAKPLPIPVVRATRPMTRREQIDAQVARHIKYTVTQAGKKFNGRAVDRRVHRIPDYVVDQVTDWDYQQIKDAASLGSPFDEIEDGVRFNPFWYN